MPSAAVSSATSGTKVVIRSSKTSGGPPRRHQSAICVTPSTLYGNNSGTTSRHSQGTTTAGSSIASFAQGDVGLRRAPSGRRGDDRRPLELREWSNEAVAQVEGDERRPPSGLAVSHLTRGLTNDSLNARPRSRSRPCSRRRRRLRPAPPVARRSKPSLARGHAESPELSSSVTARGPSILSRRAVASMSSSRGYAP